MLKLRRAVALLGCLWVLGVGATANASELVTACAVEIGALCPGVSSGRGRITACLVSNSEKLGATCRGEVTALASQTAGNRLVPEEFRRLLTSGTSASLPASCAAEADAVCPGVAGGDGRIFACLYAHSDRVSAICTADARSALN